MTSKLRMSLMAIALLATPMLATAQSNNPTGNMGANRSDTAAGTSADKMQKPVGAVPSGAAAPKSAGMANDGATPGATGTTVVPGSNSTVSGDKTGTTAAKTGQTNGGGGGK